MVAQLLSLLLAGEASSLKQRLRMSVIAYALAGLAALMAVLFLFIALYIAAALRWGAIEAAVGFAVAFAVIVAIILAVHQMYLRQYRRELERRRMENASLAATASAMAVIPALLGKNKKVTRAGVGAATLILAAIAGYAAYRQFEQRSRKDG